MSKPLIPNHMLDNRIERIKKLAQSVSEDATDMLERPCRRGISDLTSDLESLANLGEELDAMDVKYLEEF